MTANDWRPVPDTIADGGHFWPGGQRMSVLRDPASRALDATRTIWRFFAAHPASG